jgi:hypothetical protein
MLSLEKSNYAPVHNLIYEKLIERSRIMNAKKSNKINVTDSFRRWGAMALVGLLILPVICDPAKADPPEVEAYSSEETLNVTIRGTTRFQEEEIYFLQDELPEGWFGYIYVESYWLTDGTSLSITISPKHSESPPEHNHNDKSSAYLPLGYWSLSYQPPFEGFRAVQHGNHTDAYWYNTVFNLSDSGDYVTDYEVTLRGAHLSWDYENFEQWRQMQNDPDSPDLLWQALLYPNPETSEIDFGPIGEINIIADPIDNRLWGQGIIESANVGPSDAGGFIQFTTESDDPIWQFDYSPFIIPSEGQENAQSILFDGVLIPPDKIDELLEESQNGGFNVEVQPEGEKIFIGQPYASDRIGLDVWQPPIPPQVPWIKSATILDFRTGLPETDNPGTPYPEWVLVEDNLETPSVDDLLSGSSVEAGGDYIHLNDNIDYARTSAGFLLYNKTDGDLTVNFDMQSDDGVKVLINGELVHLNSVVRAPGDTGNTEDSFSATLKPGWNVVVVGVYNVTLGCGFRMKVTNPRTGDAYHSSILDMTPDTKATITYPADGATDVVRDPIITFETPIQDNIDRYEIEVIDNDPVKLVHPVFKYEVDATDSPSVWSELLDPDTNYTVKINTILEDGTVIEGDVTEFTTGSPFDLVPLVSPASASKNTSTSGGGSFDIIPNLTEPDISTEQLSPTFTESGGGDYTLAFSYNNTEDTPNSGIIFGLGDPDDTSQTGLLEAVNNEQTENSVFSLDIQGFTNNDPAPIYFGSTDGSGNTGATYISDFSLNNISRETYTVPLADLSNQGVNTHSTQNIFVGVGNYTAGIGLFSLDGGLSRTYNLSNADAAITGTILIDNIQFHPNGIKRPNLLSNPGFEDGNKTDWTHPLCDMQITSDVAHSGNYSAYIYNRTDTWQGPRHSVLEQMQNGKTYRISFWIRLENAQSDNIGLTVLQDDSAGAVYSGLQWVTGYNDRWVQLSGTYTLNVTGTLNDLQIYVEGPQPGVNFYVDDVLVEEQ